MAVHELGRERPRIALLGVSLVLVQVDHRAIEAITKLGPELLLGIERHFWLIGWLQPSVYGVALLFGLIVVRLFQTIDVSTDLDLPA
ncbi:hypothetical protein [Halapricum desulfuricans]|uniref:Uncharacterized protein n=1 Tax=Halapricum desulfuricans TaxID=2841257 RepID=A0A897NAW0_9EURY|nr:hypothetical protein [Halapricum desulfuricans]QSG08233.1 hypothetical protein HSR122_0829 [Halapricum desulfuricans]